MSMDKLIAEVNELVEKEYGRAGAKFGLTNHSDHESYAVLLEELQEARTEIDSVERQMNMFWELVKHDDDNHLKYDCLCRMKGKALLAACEAIQVAAMAKKASLTIYDRIVSGGVVEDGGDNG